MRKTTTSIFYKTHNYVYISGVACFLCWGGGGGDATAHFQNTLMAFSSSHQL